MRRHIHSERSQHYDQGRYSINYLLRVCTSFAASLYFICCESVLICCKSVYFICCESVLICCESVLKAHSQWKVTLHTDQGRYLPNWITASLRWLATSLYWWFPASPHCTDSLQVWFDSLKVNWFPASLVESLDWRSYRLINGRYQPVHLAASLKWSEITCSGNLFQPLHVCTSSNDQKSVSVNTCSKQFMSVRDRGKKVTWSICSVLFTLISSDHNLYF